MGDGKGERLTVYILELLNGRLCVYAYYTIGFSLGKEVGSV